jgi:hypothetical protein
MINLYPHQQKAVDELENGKILRGDVGVGKSRTALAYFYSKVCGGVYDDMGSMRTPRDLFIITTAKKRDSLDWEKEAIEFNIGPDRNGSVEGIEMTVDSWNNLGRYIDVKDAFFIFDEQRLVGSGTWVKSFLKIAKHNKWIVLSATPGDTWLDYIPVFIANGFYKNRTEFKLRHVVYNTYSKYPKVDHYVDVGHLVRLRHKILVDMPYLRTTVRTTKDVLVDYDEELFEKVTKKRWHVYEERPLRDVSELFSVMRKVVNSDSSRLEAIRGLLPSHPKLIVFYNFDYELEILRGLKDECWQMALDHPGESFEVKELSPSELLMESRRNSSIGSEESLPTRSETRSSDETDTTLLLESGSDPTPSQKDSERDSQNSILDTRFHTPLSGRECNSKPQDLTETLATGSTTGSDLNGSTTTELSGGLSSTCSGSETYGESFEMAEWNGHKHQQIPETDRWVYLVQYVAGAEGWNCTDTDTMLFYSLTYSYKNYHQAKGRIDRLNTPFTQLFYYVLRSNSIIDKAVWRSLSEKKDFNEFNFLQRI